MIRRAGGAAKHGMTCQMQQQGMAPRRAQDAVPLPPAPKRKPKPAPRRTCNAARQHSGGIQMREGGGGRRIGQIIGRHVDSLQGVQWGGRGANVGLGMVWTWCGHGVESGMGMCGWQVGQRPRPCMPRHAHGHANATRCHATCCLLCCFMPCPTLRKAACTPSLLTQRGSQQEAAQAHLHRGNGALLGGGNALLQLAQIRGQGGLVAHGRGDAAQQRRHLGVGLGG